MVGHITEMRVHRCPDTKTDAAAHSLCLITDCLGGGGYALHRCFEVLMWCLTLGWWGGVVACPRGRPRGRPFG